jgi:uncharacterized protein YjiK
MLILNFDVVQFPRKEKKSRGVCSLLSLRETALVGTNVAPSLSLVKFNHMFSKTDKIIFSIVGILFALAILFWSDLQSLVSGKSNKKKDNTEKSDKKDKKGENKQDKANRQEADPGIAVTQKWEMPPKLTEISGLATIDETYLACVQDELGTIFIFNTSTGKSEKEIPFAGTGDYEGISIVGPTAWIIRSDGKMFEVQGYNTAKPVVKEHTTGLTAKNDVEGLCYDEKNNRLLMAIKGKEQNDTRYKGIYEFNLTTKKMPGAPVHKIDLDDQIWANVKGKDKCQPSGLDVHPSTGDLYILDGPSSRLLVMKADGVHKKLYDLSSDDFPQPEGITFTPSAQLYVSNEGRNNKGNILKLEVSETK